MNRADWKLEIVDNELLLGLGSMQQNILMRMSKLTAE